jgi:hypothetical protein
VISLIQGDIDESVKLYLTDKHCKCPNLYFLPKIHKKQRPVPGRPVVSANGCPTEKISQLVDQFLNPGCVNIRSFVKDTTHFLSLMGKVGKIPENSFLVTLDVAALYPSIPIKEGMQAAAEALREERPDLSVRPSNRYLIKLLKLVLTKTISNSMAVTFYKYREYP